MKHVVTWRYEHNVRWFKLLHKPQASGGAQWKMEACRIMQTVATVDSCNFIGHCVATA